MRHLLIVDDDTRLRELLKKFLMRSGFTVTTAADAAQARAIMSSLDFDLLILDVMMPEEDGIAFARSLRPNNPIPILMLTAKSALEDRLAGFDAGVDDFLSKPFEPSELLARIEAVLRRVDTQSLIRKEAVFFGDYRFDPEAGRLKKGDLRIELTRNEIDIMTMLARNIGNDVARHKLAATLGGSSDANDRAVDVQITRLRKKVEEDPKNPQHILTVRGVGYRLAPR